MAFREVRFPDELSLGSSGGPLFRTHVVVMKSGEEQRNQSWAQALGVYEVGLVHRDATATNLLRRFFRSIAMGRLHGFRFRDRLPGEARGYQELVGTGDASETDFQLVKYYTIGTLTHTRTITKPVVGSVRMLLNGTPTTAFTVDTTTGIVTMTSPPGSGVIVRATYSFDVPVRFDTDQLDIAHVEPGIFRWASIRLVETRTLL